MGTDGLVTAARIAENERLRQAFEHVLEEAREDAKEYYAEGRSRTPQEYLFPYDDHGVGRDIVDTLCAALEDK